MLSMDLKSFEDYRQEVFLAYQKQKNAGLLMPNVLRSTPAKLKSEFINVFVHRYSEKDHAMFSNLLGKQDTAEDYLRLLEGCDPDIFRPLNNFLHGRIPAPKEITIKLLAFLIGFKPESHSAVDIVKLVQPEKILPSGGERPKIDEEQTTVQQTELDQKINEVEDLGNEVPAPPTTGQPIFGSTTKPDPEKQTVFGIPAKFKKTLVAFFATLIIISTSYVIYNNTDHQCMYWKSDHYESIDCFEKIEGVTPIAYGEYTLEHQRKITNLGTITKADIGKVHYSKENGNVVFYTTSGDNPEDHRKRLLPMTEYMYIKYILNRKN
jgi:hypothetical protein